MSIIKVVKKADRKPSEGLSPVKPSQDIKKTTKQVVEGWITDYRTASNNRQIENRRRFGL